MYFVFETVHPDDLAVAQTAPAMLLIALEKKVVVFDVHESVFLATLHRNEILGVAFVFGFTFREEIRRVADYTPVRTRGDARLGNEWERARLTLGINLSHFRITGVTIW